MGDKMDKTKPIFNYSLSLFDGESTSMLIVHPLPMPCIISITPVIHSNTSKKKSDVQRVTSGFYQCGFSSGATMIFTILNNQWIIATYGVCICMVFHSTFSRTGELGSYRAAVNL
jgi:hypothetical protein